MHLTISNVMTMVQITAHGSLSRFFAWPCIKDNGVLEGRLPLFALHGKTVQEGRQMKTSFQTFTKICIYMLP